MRHRKRRTKLSMKSSHRKAALQNLVRSLFRHQRITTTLRRAKEARRLADRLITMGKSGSVASRRMVYSAIPDRDMVAKLFREIVPLFSARTSGFTRIIPVGFRRGDGAELAILELTEKKVVEVKSRKGKKAAEKEKAASRPKAEHAPGPAVEEKAQPREKAEKEETRIKTIPKAKPSLEEEKKEQAAKTEAKKIEEKKSFMKNLRGFFRRKTNM